MRRLVAVSAVLLAALLGICQGAFAAGPSASGLTMLLELKHPQGLEQFVRSVSDPRSPNYRDFATVSELVARFGAKPADRRAAMRWLAARGVHGRVGPTGTYVVARVTPRLARRALPPVAAGASASSAASNERSVPAALRGHVTSIGLIGTEPGAFDGLGRIGASASAKRPEGPSGLPNTGTPKGCAAGTAAGEPAPFNGFTPNEYLDAYGHSALHRRGFQGQGQHLALIEIDGFRRSDVSTFAKCFGLRTPHIRTHLVGPKKPLPPGGETTLDLEVLSAAAPKLARVDVYEGGSSELGILLSVASALGSGGREPDAISISLGGCEPGLVSQIAFHEALDELFAVAGGAGISVLVAAGDTGSSGCRLDLEEETTALPLLSASDPASSAYVTAVGGTNLALRKDNSIKAEVTWNDAPEAFGGGGGAPSILVPQPWWQEGSEKGFGLGRLVPDVSGLADIKPGYVIFCTAEDCKDPDHPTGGWTTVGGTSAATPLYAGGVLLANGYERSHGAPPLGFLNPLIYEIGLGGESGRGGRGPGVLRDVTKGGNDLGILTPADAGGGEPLGCCSAKRGYDLASGWGSIDLPALAQVGVRKLHG